MIYNENGTIIQSGITELMEYMNSVTPLDEFLNEGFMDSVKNSSVGKGVSWVVQKIISGIEAAIKFITETCNKIAILSKNKSVLKEKIEIYLDPSRETETKKKYKNDIVKYMNSIGYQNGKWIETFQNAIKELTINANALNNLDVILYKSKSKENWFETTSESSSSNKIDADDIIKYALSIKSLSAPLKKSYDSFKKFSKDLQNKSAHITTESMVQIMNYFNKAMHSIRSLSTACINVCVQATKVMIRADDL